MRKYENQARESRHVNTGASIKIHDENDLATLLDGSPNPLILILDCIQDPHNLGACLRTADAAGCAAVILPKDRTAPLTDTVRRIACGGAESVPIVRVTNLARTMEKLKDLGVQIIGTADEAGQPLYQVDLSGPVAIVLGAEGEGMRRLTGENCDRLIRIPMGGKVPCLNVSVAAGVCLFEAVRQQQG
ncbi:MAG: 23S rRNA (guanosine(2251)-2'-O)-methyltransferase RlmB [Verrucomicrobia bacterium]|nr:23S rRNA (guanosine(2251)-2'-O)-methyltransferase RlmB [Verrucomicrobiota bacterium]